MSRRNVLLLIVALVLVLIGVLFFFLSGTPSGEDGDALKRPSDIFSFGKNGEGVGVVDGTGRIEGGEERPLQNEDGPVPTLRKISFGPVSGFGLFGTSTTLIRFVDKESGHIFETSSDNLKTTRVTNTTIPGTFNSLWIDKDNVVLRYLDDNGDIQSFSATITPPEEGVETGESGLIGGFLEKNIVEMNILGGSIFSLIDVGFGSSGIISSPDLDTKRQVWESPLKEVSVFINNNQSISILTKPSYLAFGHLFVLDTKTGFFEKSISGIKGLTTNTSPDVETVLYSRSENNGVSLWTFNNTTRESVSLSFSTLPEKCAWDFLEKGVVYCGVPKNISGRALPDEWYKGQVSFSDEIWKMNVITGEKEFLVDPADLVGENVDLIDPSLNKNSSYFVFVNKKDSSLWGLLLEK